MNRPIYSFCYISQTPQNSQHHSRALPIRSSSSRKITPIKQTIMRADQIKPSTIGIPKSPKIMSQPQLPQLTTINLEPEKISIDKPKLFNWKNIGVFCGVTRKNKISLTGCSCSEEKCPYATEWTKGSRTTDKAAYLGLKTISVSSINSVQIDKDVDRTYGDTPTFGRNPAFREMLRELLYCYSIYDQELGYVQGINLIAANLLFHIKKAEQTFWALVQLMENQELRLIFVGNMKQLTIHCNQIDSVLKIKLKPIHDHMEALGVNSRCFLDGWLLSLMSKIIPLEDMHLVINFFSKKGWKFIYSLIAELMKTLEDCLLLSEDEPQFLMALSADNCSQTGVEWSPLINRAAKSIK